MSKLTQPRISLAVPRKSDPRIFEFIGKKIVSDEPAKVALIGFPSDQGVVRNGGRAGAALAPDSIRDFLYRYAPDPRCYKKFISLLENTKDAGNIIVAEDLEAAQSTLAEVIASYLSRGTVTVTIGGGHETSFGHFLGYVRAMQAVSILNWDAHPDVRTVTDEQGTSGTAFFQALEHSSNLCKGYSVAGLLPHAISKLHLDYVTSKGGTFHYGDELTKEKVASIYAAISEPTFVSFDIDVVDQAFAPGVSAPASAGLHPDVWLHAAFEAGRCPWVRSIDIVEVNPQFDRDGQTARLAALTVWNFLSGLCQRNK